MARDNTFREWVSEKLNPAQKRSGNICRTNAISGLKEIVLRLVRSN